ncbi:MAG: cytochrome c3 family protein [Lysobacterales bacterium]
MLILLRRVYRDRKGAETLVEASHEGGLITLGHRNDQTLPLHDPSIAARHLTIKPLGGGRFSLRCVGASRLQREGESLQRVVLSPGESIDIGAQQLRVIEPPAGFNGALQLTQVEQDQAFGPATHFQIELKQTRLPMRRLAWASALFALVLLALPLAGYFNPALGGWLRAHAPLLSDAVWSSGPLANAHHTLEIDVDCNACHLRLFETTPDRGCLDCHTNLPGHVDLAALTVPKLEDAHCAGCHKEHNEPAMLVREDTALCVDCHQALPEVATHRGMARAEQAFAQAVTAFRADAHPSFRLSLLRFDAAASTWSTERIRSEPALPPRESSNLKFPHDVHLDPKRVYVRGEGDRALGCVDCHRLNVDGEHFEPITMENSCRSCHGLGFDEDEPERQLPHAAVRAAVLALEEHYIRQFADTAKTIEVGQRNRRRPALAERDPCPEGILACGRARAEIEAHNQFTRSGCVTCHEVTVHPERSVYERWQILPVKLVADFHPMARFDHVAHLTRRDTLAQDDATCLDCHAAAVSGASSDVLMPAIDTCLDCHSEERGIQNVQLACTGCHGFHLPGATPMQAALPVTHPAAPAAAGGGE